MTVQAAAAHRPLAITHPQASAESYPDRDSLFEPAPRIGMPAAGPVSAPKVGPSLPGLCSARPRAVLPSVALELRNETTGSRTVALWRTKDVREATAKSNPALRVIDATKVFRPGTVFLGFGIPNVFLGMVRDNDAANVAAQSAWRAPVKMRENHRTVQSGFFIVPHKLAAEAIAVVLGKAIEAQGRRDVTCVAANTRILAEAGFTVDGKPLHFTWPADLLKAFLSGKVKCKLPGQTESRPVHFDIVRTTPRGLDDFLREVSWAVKTSGCRHAPAPLKSSVRTLRPWPRTRGGSRGYSCSRHRCRLTAREHRWTQIRHAIQPAIASWRGYAQPLGSASNQDCDVPRQY